MSLLGMVVDDYGAVVEITAQQDGVAVDISSYTTLSIVLQAPSGAETTKAAAFKTDGTDGILQFTIANGDLDEVGGWTMQVELTKAGVRLTSDPVTRFHVGARL